MIGLSLIGLGLLATAVGSKDTKGDKADKKPKPKFTISKETTYVTEPRDKDGYIDYAAALNNRMREGVTPDNNANVLLWKALGPQPEGTKVPADFFHWMGIEPPPERGDYFIDLSRYIKEHLKIDGVQQADEIGDQYDRAQERSWKANQFPHIAGWLKVNAKPLALVIQATKRTQYFSPFVPTRMKKRTPGLIDALVPALLKLREFAAVLAARAMLHVGEGRSDEAWQDLLACHRLGRFVARSATIIQGLVGVAIDQVASGADLAFLDGTTLNAKRIKDCLRDLQKLPPMPRMADKVSLGERFILLDFIMMVARARIALDRDLIRYLEGLGGAPKVPDDKAKRILSTIDWDPALRIANEWYDRLAAAMRGKDRASRQQKLEKFRDELTKVKVGFIKSDGLAKVFQEGDPKTKGKVLGDFFVSLAVPAVSKVLKAFDRTEQTQRNLHLAFALAAYEREQGHYPKKLNDLAPKYLAKVPLDLFSGKPLIYRTSKNGYLLFSVGPNGRDDQGRGLYDDPPGDDLSVRMPLPEVPKK
jgi:hypothetical protein